MGAFLGLSGDFSHDVPPVGVALAMESPSKQMGDVQLPWMDPCLRWGFFSDVASPDVTNWRFFGFFGHRKRSEEF